MKIEELPIKDLVEINGGSRVAYAVGYAIGFMFYSLASNPIPQKI